MREAQVGGPAEGLERPEGRVSRLPLGPAGKGSAALSWAGRPASGEALAERECPSLGFKCPP